MSTTSGLCSRAASAAAEPSLTDATTTMSERSASKSSSASRKTSLSSTRRRRIGSDTRGSLFRGEEEWVVRLPAGLNVELELGMPLADPVEEGGEVGRVGSGQHREQPARLGEQ